MYIIEFEIIYVLFDLIIIDEVMFFRSLFDFIIELLNFFKIIIMFEVFIEIFD